MALEGTGTVGQLVDAARGREVNGFVSGSGRFPEPCTACAADGVERHATHMIRIEAVLGPGSAQHSYLCDVHHQDFLRRSSQHPTAGFGFTP